MSSQSISSETATPVSAIFLVIGACFWFSFLDSSGKYLVMNGMSAPFVAWARYAVHMMLALILFRAWSNRLLFRTHNLPAQMVRSMLLFGSTVFNFLALQTLQLAETVSIAFFSPMLTVALAGPLLGERAGWRRWSAIFVGFIGVLIVTRPGVGDFGLGHLYALGFVACHSFYVIMTRHMGAKESAESLIFYSALIPTVLMLPAVPLYGSMPQGALQWGLLAMTGISGGLGHWLLIKAYQRASTAALAPYPYTQIVWMVALGWFAFGDLPDKWTLVGAGVIISSGLYVIHREHKLRQMMTRNAVPPAGP